MENEKELGNLEFPSPVTYDTLILPSRQERKKPFITKVTSRGARVLGSAGLFVSTIISPIDSPKQVNADSDLASAGVPTLIDGNGNLNKTNYLILNSGASPEQIQNLNKALKTMPPYDKFEFNSWLQQPSGDLECDRVSRICNWATIDKEIDDATLSGIPVDRTIVAIGDDRILGYPRGGAGRGFQPSCSEAPTNHAPAVVVIPPPSETHWDGLVGTVAHEDAHTRCLGHNGGERPDRMWENTGSPINNFNVFHTNFLIQDNKLLPFSIRRNSFPTGSGGLAGGAAGGEIPLDKMELPIQSPIPGGTGWVKFFLEQEDGENVTLILGSQEVFEKMRKGEYRIEHLSRYILQPDQRVRTRVWISNEEQQPSWESPAWENHRVRPNLIAPATPWDRTYRTPSADSSTISPVNLANGEFTTDSTPTVQWSNANPATFYYEIQLSGDPSFNMDPGTAVSFVYWNLIHGGVAKPENSWTVPDNAALPPGKYHWRIRPRIQGSGTPVGWSQAWTFEVKPAA